MFLMSYPLHLCERKSTYSYRQHLLNPDYQSRCFFAILDLFPQSSSRLTHSAVLYVAHCISLTPCQSAPAGKQIHGNIADVLCEKQTNLLYC